MTAPLTTADLAALRALADKATPGPWTHYGRGIDSEAPGTYGQTVIGHETRGRPYMTWEELILSDADQAFIAASREAMPRLLDALETSQAEVKRLQDLYEAEEAEERRLIRERDAARAEVERLHRDLETSCTVAAEHVGRLTSERDAARAEVERLAEGYRVSELNRARADNEVIALRQREGDQRARALAAEAEVERLRGALNDLHYAGMALNRSGAPAETWGPFVDAMIKARTVLGEEGTK